MVKKIFLYSLSLFMLSLSLVSCIDDDDDIVIDQEWKSLNEKRFNDLAAGNDYQKRTSESRNGSILYRESKIITEDSNDNHLRIAVDGRPEFTDTVVVRYEGWYFNINNEKLIFDSTENPSLRTQIAYSLGVLPSADPNKIPATFPVNRVVDGWTTILQEMNAGDEYEIVVPHQLGYGSTPSTYAPSNTSASYTIIPAYTTLHFRIKLLRIIPMKGRS